MSHGPTPRASRTQVIVDTASVREFVRGYMARAEERNRSSLVTSGILLTAAALSRYGSRTGRR